MAFSVLRGRALDAEIALERVGDYRLVAG